MIVSITIEPPPINQRISKIRSASRPIRASEVELFPQCGQVVALLAINWPQALHGISLDFMALEVTVEEMNLRGKLKIGGFTHASFSC